MWDILKHKETSGGEGYTSNRNCGDRSFLVLTYIQTHQLVQIKHGQFCIYNSIKLLKQILERYPVTGIGPALNLKKMFWRKLEKAEYYN